MKRKGKGRNKVYSFLLSCALLCSVTCIMPASAAQIESQQKMVQPEMSVRPMDASVYQLLEDYEAGRYTTPVIEDASFNPDLFFGPSTFSASAENVDTIYQVKAVEGKENEYVATQLRAYDLRKTEEAQHKDVVIMCRVVYRTVLITGSSSYPAYHIVEIQGGVVRNSNSYVAEGLYLRGYGSSLEAYDLNSNYAGYQGFDTGWIKKAGFPVTGSVYSIPSGNPYYYAPDTLGGTGGFCKVTVVGAHTSYAYELEAKCGFV